jgi:hypothetical protein
MSWASKKSDDATFWRGCHKSLLSASLWRIGSQTIATSSLDAPEKWHQTQNPRLKRKSSTLDLRGEKNGASISF